MGSWIWASSALPARRATVFWSPSGTASPAGQEKWLSLFTLSSLTSSSVCSSGSSVQEGHKTIRVYPEKGDQVGERSSEKDLQRAADITYWEGHYPNANTGKKTPYITLSLWKNSLWLWNVCDFWILKSCNFIYYFHENFRTWRQIIYLKTSTSWSFQLNIWPMHFLKGLESRIHKVSNQNNTNSVQCNFLKSCF